MASNFHSAEDVANGTTVTTSNNTGAAGDLFNALAGTAPTFSTSANIHGTQGYRFPFGATSVQGYVQTQQQYATSQRVVARFYYRADSTPNSENPATWLTNASGGVSRMVIDSTGHLFVGNTAGTTISGSTSSVALVANVWYRIEFAVTVATTTTGRVEYAQYRGDSTTAEFSFDSGAAVNCGTTAPARFRVGRWAAIAATRNIDLDDIALAPVSSGFIGPTGGTPVLFDASSSTTNTTTQSAGGTTTLSHTTSGTNRALVVSISAYNSGGTATGASGVTYNGVAMTAVGNGIANSNQYTEQWYLANPATGANNIVVTAAGTTHKLSVSGVSFTNVNQTSPIDGFNSATGSATSVTASLTTTANSGYMVDAVAHASVNASTAHTNNQIYSDVTSLNTASQYGATPATGANTMSWTYAATNNWAYSVANVKAATNIITLTQPTVARIATNPTKTQPSVARIANSVTKTQSVTARISAPGVTIVNKLSNTSSVGGSSVATASWTPTANTLYLASITTRTGITADPNVPTASGNGLTWVQVATSLYDDTSSSRRRVTLFRAMGASPTTGALTFDEAGQAQTDFGWSIEEVTGMDTSGTNGSGAIVQSVVQTDPAGVTTETVTLAAFSSTSNATFGTFGYTTAGAAITIGSGFTQLADVILGGSSTRLTTEWKSTNDTTVDLSPDGTQQIGGIAVEIKAAGTGSILTKTQPSTARIANNLTKTQPTVARVATNLTKTQPTVARIANSRTKTQPAIARIANNPTTTQPVVARIQKVVAKTQPAIARVAVNKTLTQPTVARISQSFTKTQSVIARITQTVVKTQSVIARVQKIVTKTQPTVARVAVNQVKTQPVTARIANSPTKTQPLLARIQKSLTLTQPTVARIATNRTKTQSVIANITNTTSFAASKTQTVVARIATKPTLTRPAIARIAQTLTKTQTLVARVSLSKTKTQPSISRISKTLTLNQSVTATIKRVVTKTQSVSAYIDTKDYNSASRVIIVDLTSKSITIGITNAVVVELLDTKTLTIDLKAPTALTLDLPSNIINLDLRKAGVITLGLS